MAQMDRHISSEERTEIIQRYDGFNPYKLFHEKPWRVCAVEAQHYRRTHNGKNQTYNANLERSNKVINVLDGKLGMYCISDGYYRRMIWSGKHSNLLVPKVTKYKIVNGKKRASRTEIIPNDEEIDKIIREEKIDDLDNANVTMALINRKRGENVPRKETIFEPAIQVESGQATCIKNPKVYETLLPGPNTKIRKIPRPSS
jgi:hypothetical protein